MGKQLVAAAGETPGITLSSVFETPDHPAVGEDSGQVATGTPNGIPITGGPEAKADVLIDFTTPEATRQLLLLCAQEGMRAVIGTTGLGDDEHAAIDEAAGAVPVVQAPNMSLGVNLLFALAGRVAEQLGDDYDAEILEAHHRYKKDAPSGTAAGLARAICEAKGKDLDHSVRYHREGPRQRGEVTVQSLRMGDVVGEHTAAFAGLGERVELRHVATARDTFARGALRAAAWVKDRPPARYSMKDVLGI